MTGHRVLVVRLPAGTARAEELPEIAEYVSRALIDGVLVLGEGVGLEVMELPPLGAVEVKVEDPAPEPKPERRKPGRKPKPKPEITPVPASLPEPKPAPARKTESKPPRRSLQMAEGDIVRDYRQAKDPKAQIRVLAELNACPKDEIEAILREAGEELPGEAGTRKNGGVDG